MPFIELAKECAGTKLAKNIVTLGLLSELFRLPQEPLEMAIKGKFAKKKAEVLEANLRGFEAGKIHASKIADAAAGKRMQYTPGEPMLLMSGNELSCSGGTARRLSVLRRLSHHAVVGGSPPLVGAHAQGRRLYRPDRG